MGKFLKKLQKGFKSACLTATLATCWSAGQTAMAAQATYEWGQEVTVQLSGTVSPTQSNISNLYLIYGTGYSGLNSVQRINIGDFPANQSLGFQCTTNTEYYTGYGFGAIGLYGDISSGTYIEGTNGVVLGLGVDDLAGNPLDWYCWGTGMDDTEAEIFGYILNGQIENVNGSFCPAIMEYHDYEDADWIAANVTLYLYNFSEATPNGSMNVQAAIPEPITLVLFGGGTVLLALRRRNK